MYTTVKPQDIIVPSKHDYFYNGSFQGTRDKSVSMRLLDTRKGTKVEEYANKIRKREDASSDFESEFFNHGSFPSSRTQVVAVNGTPNQITEVFTGVLNPITTVNHVVGYTDEERAKAVAKLVERLRSERTVFNSIPFLGELPSTIKLIVNPLSALRTGLTKHFNLLKLNKERAKKVPFKDRRRVYEDMITGTYLEWVFGAMPLYSDITGMLEVVKQMSEREFPASRQTTRSTFSNQVSTLNPAAGYVSSDPGWNLVYDGISTITQTELRVQYSVGIDITQSLNSSELDRLLNLSGFRLDEFVVGVYNAMPWTWLVDYFTSMGNFLSSVTLDTSNVRWINETLTLRTFAQQFTGGQSYSNAQAQASASGRTLLALTGDFGYSNIVRTSVVRKRLQNVPIVPLKVYRPGIPSIRRTLNVAAVALQLREHSDLRWLSKRGP